MNRPGDRLLGLLRGDPSWDRGPGGIGQPMLDEEWEVLNQLAAQLQLGPLVYRLLEDRGALSAAPSEVRDRLRTVYVQTAARNALMFRDTARAATMLDRAGIPMMLLKGVHLARYVFPEPALRSMADLDLMVPQDRLLEAEQMFLQEGYGPVPRPDPVEFCSRSNHLAKLTKEGAHVVELHWTVERPTSPFPIDVDSLWRRAQPVTFNGVGVWVLGPEDVLLHLILHVSYHHGFDRSAIKGLVDIRYVVDRHEQELDWDVLVTRANAWGVGGFAYTTLRLASEILGTKVPKVVLEGLAHSPADEDIVRAAHRYVLMPPSLPSPFMEVAHRTGSDRWRMILRRLFPPRPTLAKLYGLSPKSAFVYPMYLVRMLGLMVRRGILLLQALLPGTTRAVAIERETTRQRIEAWVKAGDTAQISPR